MVTKLASDLRRGVRGREGSEKWGNGTVRGEPERLRVLNIFLYHTVINTYEEKIKMLIALIKLWKLHSSIFLRFNLKNQMQSLFIQKSYYN